MAKKVVGYIKLQVKAGQANPSPPVGPALGQRGLNIMEFCKAFNAATSKLEPGLPTPVIITAYSDRLIDDLSLIDWPESVAQMQRNWMEHGVRNARRKMKNGSDPDKAGRKARLESTEKQASKARQTERAIERLEVVAEPRKEWELRM